MWRVVGGKQKWKWRGGCFVQKRNDGAQEQVVAAERESGFHVLRKQKQWMWVGVATLESWVGWGGVGL